MGPCSECGAAVGHREIDGRECTSSPDNQWLHQSLRVNLDALFLALQARDTMLDNLTATQARCTELFEANRALKAEVARLHGVLDLEEKSYWEACSLRAEVRASDALKHEWIDKHNRLFDIYKEQESELVDLKVENERLETLNRRMDIALCDCCNGTATWRGEPCPECNPEGDFVEDQDT